MTPNDESRYVIRELTDVEELPPRRGEFWDAVVLVILIVLALLVPEGLPR